MFWNKDKENEIVFYTKDPGPAELFPVLPASQVKFDWVKKTTEQFKEQKKLITDIKDEANFTHVRTCPGIFDVCKTGYVVPITYDICIRYKEGKLETYSAFEKNPSTKDPLGREYSIPESSTDPVVEHRKIPGINRTILKFESPYFVKAPKGVKLLFMPLPYNDTYHYEANMGILDPAVTNNIAMQFWWNKKEEIYLKAGTPMMQIIPLTEKKLDMVCRAANEKELKFLNVHDYNILSQFRILKSKEKISKAYNRFIKND